MGGSMGGLPDDIESVVTETAAMEIARVKRSTWQNWVRQGIDLDPLDGRWAEPLVLELTVVAQLVPLLDLSRTQLVWKQMRARGVPWREPAPALTMLIDMHTLEPSFARDSEELGAQLSRPLPFVRAHMALPVGALLRDAHRAFTVRSTTGAIIATDRRRRASRRM